MELKRYLVYYFNGLITTSMLITSQSHQEARDIFENDLKDENFKQNHCHTNECYVVFVEEIK